MADSSSPGMIHTVYFWLQPNLTDADHAAFAAGCQALAAAPTVLHYYGGPPAATPARAGVTQNDYDYNIHLFFADEAAHNAYQEDPVHLKFVSDHAAKFKTVRVYDNRIQ